MCLCVTEVGCSEGWTRLDLHTKYTVNLEFCEYSRRGRNLPELGCATETDAVGEQQLKGMQSGSKANEEEVAER